MPYLAPAGVTTTMRSDHMPERDIELRVHLSDEVVGLAGSPSAAPVQLTGLSDADVVVVVNAQPHAPLRGRAAILRIVEPDVLPIGPAADLDLSVEAFVADPAAAARHALDRRLTRRPSGHDALEVWLSAVQRQLSADGAAFVNGQLRAAVGDMPDPTPMAGPRFEAGAQAGALLLGADGVAVVPVRWGDDDGSLVVAVREDGVNWLAGARPDLQAIAAAATAAAADRRLHHLESQLGLVRSMLGVVVHDLRGAMFGLELGTRLLDRVPAAAPVRDNLAGSVGVPMAQVCRTLSDVRTLLQTGSASGSPVFSRSEGRSGASPLDRVWAEAVAGAARAHPDTPMISASSSVPPGATTTAPDAAATIFEALLDNALREAAGAPVRVRWLRRADQHLVLEIRNPGTLPFDRVAQLEPFTKRARGRAGLGLYVARTVAASSGIELDVVQDGPDAVATVAFAQA
jgi:signal transduction histidine kinase